MRSRKAQQLNKTHIIKHQQKHKPKQGSNIKTPTVKTNAVSKTNTFEPTQTPKLHLSSSLQTPLQTSKTCSMPTLNKSKCKSTQI